MEGKRKRTLQAGRPFGAVNRPRLLEPTQNRSITELFNTQAENSLNAGNTQAESSLNACNTQTNSTETVPNTQSENMDVEE